MDLLRLLPLICGKLRISLLENTFRLLTCLLQGPTPVFRPLTCGNTVGVREVSDTLEHLEATARPRVVGGVRVSDGNDPVAISPDQEGG